jgi:oligo-1,6-glucosidase
MSQHEMDGGEGETMNNKHWWKECVVYQVYPRSFNDSNGDGVGDIPGIIEKLDYLKTLGIDVIWLSPVYDSPNDDNGYDIRDYQKIMHEFGVMEDMERLINEAHQRDIKIMMDLVVNHTSDEHEWFVESRSSKDNEKRDYYIWRQGKNGEEPNKWGSVFGGSSWEYNVATEDYYLHLFSKKQPDLNWENPDVRRNIYNMMTWWLDKGIDGFRMDVINFISKDQHFSDGEKLPERKYTDGSQYFMNGPRIHEFLQEMNREVLSHYDIMTVGEMPGVTIEDGKKYTDIDRKELNMVFHFEHMGLGDGAKGKWSNLPWKLSDLKAILSKWQNGLSEVGWNSLYWNNHDQPRVVSRFGNDGVFWEKSAKMLATCLHLMKGTPFIYQGEELGMTNVQFPSITDYKDLETLNMYQEEVVEYGSDPDKVMKAIYARGRDNARTPMQWDSGKQAGFTTGTPWIKVNPNFKEINAQKALDDPSSIFYYYQKLIKLRHGHDIVKYGNFQLLNPEDESTFAYTRTLNGKVWLVICNFTEKQVQFQLPNSFINQTVHTMISNTEDLRFSNLKDIELGPFDAFVFEIANKQPDIN